MKIEVNGTNHTIDVEGEMPLLWVLREELGLRGTKFSCGKGLCGACTVHVDGRAQRSCITTVASVQGMSIRTIEDLGTPENPHPIQKEWLDMAVPQCGYCQPGMQMAAAAFLDTHQETARRENPNAVVSPPTDEDIRRSITNICRCGCYERIRKAIVNAGMT
jgi:isoquinoline 1-oxidoreductase alpha subunit